MSTYQDHRKLEEGKRTELLKIIYQIAVNKVEFYQKQRYVSIGFVATLEIACLTGFSYLPHAPVSSVSSKLIVIAGYIFLPVLGAILLGGLWLNENRLKDYYNESFDACIKIESDLSFKPGLFARLKDVPKETILSLDHTKYFRVIMLFLAFLWALAFAFGIVEANQVWYNLKGV